MELAELIARRAALAEEHDAARSRWPHTHPEFVRAVDEVARGLQAIATQIVASRNIVEIAKTRMWLGDALFDLAQSRNAPFQTALAAYRGAEDLVQIANDPVLQAKFDANYANILLRADPGPDVVADVIARYERSLPVLRVHQPAFATAIESELARARLLLSQLEELSAELERRRREVRDMLAALAQRPDTRDLELMTALLRELGEAHAEAERTGDVASTLNLMERIRAAYQRAMNDVAPAAPGPYGRLAATLKALWIALNGSNLTSQVDTLTRNRGYQLASELVAAMGAVTSAREAELGEVCRRTLLPLARNAGRLLSRSLVTWVEPHWPPGPSPELPHGLYVTESPLRESVVQRARRLGLELLEASAGRDLAEARFDAIRQAAVVVADLPEDAAVRASTCYEIGIALALGRPLVVLTPAGSTLPFDIEVQPVLHPTGEAGWALFDDALERALLLPQRAPDEGNLEPLLHAARQHFALQQANVDELEKSLEHPLQAAGVLAGIVREQVARTGAPHLVVHTPWMRRYPEAGTRRLFHVMPFRPGWSDTVMQRTAAACASVGVFYHRGDQARDLRIIRAIWDDLCLASHVLVDLTGWNANVCLELGVAQVLGKAVLVVGQTGTSGRLFPMLKNVRVQDYALESSGYEVALARFLAAP